MRRSLSRATAVCVAHALVVALGLVAPATVGNTAFTDMNGTVISGERSGEPAQTGPSGPGRQGSEDHRGSTTVDTSFELDRWTHVDRAFPDRPAYAADIASVGTGHLAWDQDYTRRALFRFPVQLAPDAVVDSAVLRTEVAWSYDCAGESDLELHRVDPFHAGATWNDQPTARVLLDTRTVQGGRPDCPVSGGVEFDVTEAYQWAVDNGEAHVHLRLGDRDEAETGTWRRFDLEDGPPVLEVDHSTPRTDQPSGSRDGAEGSVEGSAKEATEGTAEDTETSGDYVAATAGEAARPSPDRPAPAPEPSDSTVPVVVGDDDVRGLVADGRSPTRVERSRSRRGEQRDRSTVSGGHRHRAEDIDARARGPPVAALFGDHTPVH